jgi:ATP-dependent DNA helicase RecQ
VLLSEYVQEVGRAGRDGKPAEALTLVGEPTGWLDPEDQQRQKFFQERVQQQQQTAQKLVRQLPVTGEVNAVARQFKEGAIALSLLHSAQQLEWQDPFHYEIDRSIKPQFSNQATAARLMSRYLTTKDCRWKVLLQAFGFSQEAELKQNGCGHCDRCLH